MKLELRYIDRTKLDTKAYGKLVRKYAKLKHKIIIIFDKKIKTYYGQYSFDSEKKMHTIRISLKKNKSTDPVAEKYQLISTTLHELAHAKQKEELGVSYWSRSQNYNDDIANKGMSELYSSLEVQAREYENKNILDAVAYYDKFVK